MAVCQDVRGYNPCVAPEGSAELVGKVGRGIVHGNGSCCKGEMSRGSRGAGERRVDNNLHPYTLHKSIAR